VLLLLYSALSVAVLWILVPDPHSVNSVFSFVFVWVSIALILVFLLAHWLARFTVTAVKHDVPAHVADVSGYLLVAMLPMASIAQYLIANREIIGVVDLIVILTIFLIISVGLVVIIPWLLGRYSSPRLLVSVAHAYVFTVFNMATISSSQSWYGEGNIFIQLTFFAIVLIVTWFLLRLNDKRDLTFVVVVFVVGYLALAFMTENSGPVSEPVVEAAAENRLAVAVEGKQPRSTPNIYLLVYDAYVPNEIMLSYGIDNSDQEKFLAEQGFTLYPHAYSVAASSLATMNRVLNISNTSRQSLGVNGDGTVQHFLRSLDYRTAGLFKTNYFFRFNGPLYDYYTPHNIAFPVHQSLIARILMGEFRFDIDLAAIEHTEYVQAKREVFANPGEDPLFVYTHSLVPGHSQDSGACLPDETQLFEEKLRRANSEMRQDVETLIASDPDSIIIVAGDHGPYLTKNCYRLTHYSASEIDRLDIQDRFGTFLAIRWPEEDYSQYGRITVLQDVFPAVFAWMYRDEALLDLRIEPVTIDGYLPEGVYVRDGVIVGGPDDGQPLFLSNAPIR